MYSTGSARFAHCTATERPSGDFHTRRGRVLSWCSGTGLLRGLRGLVVLAVPLLQRHVVGSGLRLAATALAQPERCLAVLVAFDHAEGTQVEGVGLAGVVALDL